VGRLRVKGSRYFLPSKIKEQADSMAEGTVPNFNESHEGHRGAEPLAGSQDHPELRAGVVPGTVDIDLIVEDKLPLHGSLELNNQYNANTVPLRLNGSLSYSNLWQLGHTIGMPAFRWRRRSRPMARCSPATTDAGAESSRGLSVMLTGAVQDSNISTLGGGTVSGKGTSSACVS
jgi:hemolysin activation/secretion protein